MAEEELTYESLPQREARVSKRRRRQQETAAGSEPGLLEGSGGGVEEADASTVTAAAAAAGPGESGAGGGASSANGAADAAAAAPPPLPPRAQPGASTSGSGSGNAVAATAAPPLPRLQHIDVPEFRTSAVPGHKFEYLDHTADVQLHAWGATLEEAFANTALAMFNYMTPLEGVRVDPSLTRTFEAEGHDLHSLLYAFLDELLFVFATELLVCREVEVTALDRKAWRIAAVGRGERFERGRHEAGTEVKAVTYSAMQVAEAPGDCEVFVIVDI